MSEEFVCVCVSEREKRESMTSHLSYNAKCLMAFKCFSVGVCL